MKTVLTILLALPASWAERDIESPLQRAERMANVAEVLDTYTIRANRAAAIAIADGESKFAAYTENVCTEIPKGAANCDLGKARSYWQLQEGACPELWKVNTDSEAVKIAAYCAVKQWNYAMRICKGNVVHAFAKYGGAGCRDTPVAVKKAALFTKLMSQL
jgi:hypothetical protein